MQTLRILGGYTRTLFQWCALIIFAATAVGLSISTGMAVLGQWDWITLPLTYQGQPIENAGMYAQIGLTILAVGLCFFLPSNRRILQLETSHRAFHISMQDVARAYAAVHAADRQGTFNLSNEFDAVRERLSYLRDHPDLSALEPQVLEVAAQMSHLSSELASVYADDKIDRARSFLKERQKEVDLFNARLAQAKQISTEMKHWLHEVELEESVAVAQLERLRAEMREIMPELGIEKTLTTAVDPDGTAGRIEDITDIDNTVVEIPPKAAE